MDTPKCPVCFLSIPEPFEIHRTKIKCPRCGTKFDAPSEILDEIDKNRASRNITPFTFKPSMEGTGAYENYNKYSSLNVGPFKKKVKSDTPQGCALSLLGLLVLLTGIFNPILLILGIVLITWGFQCSHKKICSECGNKVEDTSKLCPACKVTFTD